MSATARLLGCGVTLGLTLTVSSVLASPYPWDGGTHLGWLALGQASQTSNSDARKVAEQWLHQARDAMNQGDLERAEYCIERAEKQNAQYDPLFARFKDTPAKVRQDLEKLRERAAQPDTKSAHPLARLLHREQNQPQPPTDPYAGGVEGVAAATGVRAPAVGGAATPASVASPSPTTGPDVAERQQRSSELLLAARQTLAKGDAARANLLVAQARKLQLTYPLNADSPDRVEVLVRKASAFAQGPGPDVEANAYTRDFAQFLLDQATGLANYRAFDDAQRLAQQAKDLRAEFGQFDRTPDQVLTQIDAARRHALAAAGGAAPGGSRGSLSDASTNDDLRRLPPADVTNAGGKEEALRLVALARAALDRGDLMAAQQYAQQAQGLAPDSAYGPDEMRPWMILLEVSKAQNSRGAVMPAANFEAQQAVATDGSPGGNFPVAQGLYDPARDTTRNAAAQALQPTPAGPPADGVVQEAPLTPGERLYREGLQALESHDRETAMQRFRDAWQYERELDPLTRQQLQDKLALLQAASAAPAATPEGAASPLEAVDAKQQLLRQKLYREITSEQAEAQRMSESDPKAALERLESLRDRISDSEVDPGSKKQLLTLVDRSVESLRQYMELNRADIALTERNREVQQGVQLGAQRELEVQNELARLVEEFNKLLDEQRYAEAERIAKQAKELAPDAEVVQNLLWQSRFVRRMAEQMAIKDDKEQGFYSAMRSVDESGVPFDDKQPYIFAEAKQWADMSGMRARFTEQGSRMTKEAMEIQKAMQNKVDVKFSETPLSEVMDVLSELSGVPIVLDPSGMAAEGVTSDTPVTIRLNQQISLRSALNLILAPLRLSHVIQDEVLRVTSEQARDSNVYPQVYNVGDLVIPIPNFVPGYNTGLAGAIKYAHDMLGYGGSAMPMGRVPLTFAANDGMTPNGNSSVLAQMGAGGMLRSLSEQQQPMGFGPGGMGGAAMADFDTLMELITSTIAPDSWDEVGGAGAIEPFPVNLSLVISQTQEVHEQIADLLDQLRRLQDLQVTIEVRFITLSDSFFERIGIDFDFAIDDNVNVDLIRGSSRTGGQGDDNGPSAVIGVNQQGPTTSLDLEFSQGSFGSTLPQFGAFDAGSAANFGFAILSDLEVFFLLEAAEGDQRTNVLQAPKVTLFNGQTASVMDFSQQPFVTSIIPVVGDFAAAQQPVIVVLSEGTQLNVQAVVSSDRRFVRLTLVPFFSRIGPVDEFTFEGRTTTDSGTIVTDPETGEPTTDRENEIISREGTTVQLPTFIFTTVSTTVSVPDGGTVLLGGIKRLSESRVERGVPMLSKLPYVNRLFKNVGIGRDTESLMMMVTPRIIIQEEEELRQTGYDSAQ